MMLKQQFKQGDANTGIKPWGRQIDGVPAAIKSVTEIYIQSGAQSTDNF